MLRWGETRGTHLHGGSAIECEGLDLPILQENFQHIGNEEESFLLQHVLEAGEQEEAEGTTVSDEALMAFSASLSLHAQRRISLENPLSLRSL